MASAGEEENINQEISGRRTRSGRKVLTSPVVTTRAKRNKKDIVQEQLIDEEAAEITPLEDKQEFEQILEPSDLLTEMLTATERNANTEEVVVYNNFIEYQEQVEVEEDVEMYNEGHNNTEVPVAAEAGIDDKSSSFPFGTAAGQSESSEEVQNEEDTSGEKGAVDGSLLASLAGDNANSLPSVGGCEELDGKKEDFSTAKVISSQSNHIRVKLDSEDSLSEPAIAESLADATDASNATIVNTELVSEDELPLLSKPEINDAEEVSDDELPAPKRAELPADAEVISEDELPPNADKKSPFNNSNDASVHLESGKQKRKAEVKNHKIVDSSEKHEKQTDVDEKKQNSNDEEYNPMSPTSESDDSVAPTEKKVKLDTELEDNENRHEGEKEKDKTERKRLPELDKYWRPVNEDPADFTGWTYLLQYVDNESDADAAREAYDAFLSQYPYCYGYWRKYADYEKRKGIKANCNVVFERGLAAIPLSVDLWIHYLSHVKSTQPDDETYIRSQFDRSIDACGLEFRSDKLWDAFIKWESDAKRYQHAMLIYERLLGIPTQGYNGHFDNFQDMVNNHSLASLLPEDHLKKLRLELHEGRNRRSKSKETEGENDTKTDQPDAADNERVHLSEKIADQEDLTDLTTLTEEEIVAIKSRIIAQQRKVHKNTVAAVTARWTFEEGIKRPYFHVKPLERCQLKNWKDYLDFEIERGDRHRILVLFERCLIACALYDEFWLKMIRYLESEVNEADNVHITRDVYRRACEIHHPDKPSLHLMWSAFEECQNNFERAASVLVNLERKCSNLLQVAYRRINVERRRGDLKKSRELYEYYITNAKNKTIAGSLAIKYARFLNKICNDLESGLNVLQKTLEKDPANTRVALQMIDLALQRTDVNEVEVVEIMDRFMAREGIDPEQKVLFAQRKVEFLEDFGSTAKGLQNAQRALQIALNKANETKKKRESSPSRKSVQGSNTANTTVQANNGYNNASGAIPTAAASYNYTGTANSTYYGQSSSGGSGYQQQAYDNYYNQWQYGSGYSGYGQQWSGYGNYY